MAVVALAFSLAALASVLVSAEANAAEPNPVTAIDILLDPDATMIQHAEAANARLRKDFLKGFALDTTHHPHISCLQRYVKTADLDKVYEAVGKVLAEEKPLTWKLKAYKYYYIPWKDLGLAGIVIEPTDDLLRYQQKLIDAVAPFTVETGTAAAFVTTPEDPEINQPTISPRHQFIYTSADASRLCRNDRSPAILTRCLARVERVFCLSPAYLLVELQCLRYSRLDSANM